MKLKPSHNPKSTIAVTGRVENWDNNRIGRLPVSCTTFVVEDAMDDKDGIDDSYKFTSYGLRYGQGISIHLSKLRPEGTTNAHGLVASGPMSFAEIYSKYNKVLRRGGLYKNGAVVLHLDYTHDDVLYFVNGYNKYSPRNRKVPEEQLLSEARREYAWAKRCLNVDDKFLETASDELIEDVLKAIARGDLWLNKIRYDDSGERIYPNVCLEVYLPHRGTCLLIHANMGQAEVGAPDSTGHFDSNIVQIFEEGMTRLCELHAHTGVDKDGQYLPPEIDRQVGFGVVGFANFLAHHGVTYKEFADAAERLERGENLSVEVTANRLVLAYKAGIDVAAEIARRHNMVRAFAIAPTASCSYRYVDLKGFTTTPELAPPISRQVDRDSETFGVQSYDYGDVEIAGEVGWEDYFRAVNGVLRLYQQTGLFHGYSFNSWSDVIVYDRKFLEDWFESPQTSLYYALQVQTGTLGKDDALVSIEDEELKTFFSFDIETPAECSIEPEPTGYCSVCSE
jgi:hypothetical protein